MKKYYLLLLVCVLCVIETKAQLKISGQVRPRTELYNGNNNGKVNGANVPGLATQQRTRLTFTYTGEKGTETEGLKIVFSPQLVNFWGQMPQAYDLLGDGAPGAPEANFSVFEAYAQYQLTPSFALKFGRQAISYGDQRWFGALGWAASGRAHDAFVGKFKLSPNTTLDLGVALNQTRHLNDRNVALQNIRGGYKSMQYVWFETKLKGGKVKLPIMVNNVTNQVVDEFVGFTGVYTDMVTLGTMPTIKLGEKTTLNASAYYQFIGDKHAASLLSASLTQKFGKTPITFGIDVASGKASNDTDSKTKTWRQPFGTNHKFYGFMDFFYVGEQRTEGLNDIFLKTAFKTGDKSKLIAHAHYFTANKDFVSREETTSTTTTKSIGSEIDLIYNLNVSKAFNFKLGYSHFFASKDFGVVPSDDINNWMWMQLTAKF